MRDPTDQATPDMFAPPPPAPRIGDCIVCWGEHLCATPEICFPSELPEERRL